MKKHIINIGNITFSQIVSLKRETSGGNKGVLINSDFFTISGWSGRNFLPNQFNDPNFYIRNRKIEVLPESTNLNTVITNDGLVGVVYSISGVSFLSILDIIEEENTTYGDIAPVDYNLLSNYNELTNPSNKRVFICNSVGIADGNGKYILETNRREIYRKNGYVYFESEMDYPIIRPINDISMENGYYRINEAGWTSATTNFQFLKKQFFRIVGPEDLEISLLPEDSSISIEKIGTDFYRLKYLNIGIDNPLESFDSFINFELKTSQSYCSIVVY
jgi:hypothetical protein